MIRDKLVPAIALLLLQTGCVHWYNVGASFCGTAATMCTSLEGAVPEKKEQLAKAASDLHKSEEMLKVWGNGKGVVADLEANIAEAEDILKGMPELSAQQKIIVQIVATTLSMTVWIIGNNIPFKVERHQRAKKFLDERNVSTEQDHNQTRDQLILEFNKQVPNVPGATTVQ